MSTAATEPLQGRINCVPGVPGRNTQQAIDFFKTGKPGDRISRDELSAIVGRDCGPDGKGNQNVRTAIWRVVKQFGIFWKLDREAQEFVCLDSEKKTAEGQRLIRLIQRRANRAMSLAASVDTEALSEGARRDYSLNVAITGVLQLCAAKPFRKSLGQTNGDHLGQPDLKKLVEFMKT